ncbi:hypothetical protein P389DRAFT_202061 [Cystobasidium minutum MCA 4210]|uniref:uncharacterized protein n=1 Tax=Cystobasidium minutum MCA 4210 TaxID=1397322 RepID=UPI0034CF6873|eukprot:jgi/Rhomi1/202061/MIX2890_216_100
MPTVRQRAKAAAKPQKKAVKPVLTNPHVIQWPQLSQPAQAQIESSLWQLLTPLAHAREHQYEQASKDSPVESPPQASTSKLVIEATGLSEQDMATDPSMPIPEDDDLTQRPKLPSTNEEASSAEPASKPTLSKRAKHREYLRKKVEKRDEHLKPGTHELNLRSGKSVQVPDRQQPERFMRKLRLDKGKALETRPSICDAMVIGLNAVTRYLEDSIDAGRRHLAGLPPIAHTSTLTAKDDLRLFVPAPNRGTRRDRRALKERLHPKSKLEKAQSKRNRVLDNLTDMPPYLIVPRDEPALVFVLQDMQSRLKKAIRTPTQETYLYIIDKLLPILTSNASDASDEAGEVDMASTLATPAEAGSAYIPTDYIIDLLFPHVRPIGDGRDHSILLSLFSRFDPEWFRLWNARRQAMSRLGQIGKSMQQPGVLAEKSVPTIFRRPIQLLFVAKGDINPLHIAQHLLTAVAAYNSLNIARQAAGESKEKSASETADNLHDIYLVPLGKGAEQKLAGLLALRRVSVLAFSHNDTPEYKKLVELVKTHLSKPLAADWLIPAVNSLMHVSAQPGNLVSTHIKLLQTTMPADIKALRAEKLGEKKRKREEARDRAASDKESKKARKEITEAG